jgi:hypothetical protein
LAVGQVAAGSAGYETERAQQAEDVQPAPALDDAIAVESEDVDPCTASKIDLAR